jgi:hypothetical protein
MLTRTRKSAHSGALVWRGNRSTETRTGVGMSRDKAGSCMGIRVFGAIYGTREDADKGGDEDVPR